jgi:hypothetical protein
MMMIKVMSQMKEVTIIKMNSIKKQLKLMKVIIKKGIKKEKINMILNTIKMENLQNRR